jgi:hypothetical protein
VNGRPCWIRYANRNDSEQVLHVSRLTASEFALGQLRIAVVEGWREPGADRPSTFVLFPVGDSAAALAALEQIECASPGARLQVFGLESWLQTRRARVDALRALVDELAAIGDVRRARQAEREIEQLNSLLSEVRREARAARWRPAAETVAAPPPATRVAALLAAVDVWLQAIDQESVRWTWGDRLLARSAVRSVIFVATLVTTSLLVD